jgi:hypothetical protein
MKIRTIVGILLVFALVLGSTGVAAAECEPVGGGPHNDDQGGPHYEECPDYPDGDCDPSGPGDS